MPRIIITNSIITAKKKKCLMRNKNQDTIRMKESKEKPIENYDRRC